MCSGISIHSAADALGISAIFYSSALAFNIVKYGGAAYLLFFAWKTLREHQDINFYGKAANLSGFAIYRRGFTMNVLNLKVAPFFFAFLPQFVSPQSANVALEILFYGAIFMLQGMTIFTAIALLSGTIGNYLLKNPKISKLFTWMTSVVLATLGVRLALAHK